MEEREEAMVSPFGGDPFLRTAHFLKPTNTNPLPLSPLSKAQIFDVRETPLNVRFKSTAQPPDRWKYWVYKLLPKYQNIWKKAGIFDAILNSTYKIIRHDDLIFALAERWCVETNTFVFPWGESTITLEDMIVLAGYSVLGDYISIPLKTNEMMKIKEKLIETRKNISSGKKFFVCHTDWMGHFIDTNDEHEHVAFLVLWLSKYVFSMGQGGVMLSVFPIAIHLSLGTRLAIAPSVLANIYRDLSLLNKSIISKGANFESEKLYILAPMQLLQCWAWERFPSLRPSPNLIQAGEPRSARWHNKKQVKIYDLGKVLDSCGEDFQWRPYCMVVNNWKFNDFYSKNGELVSVESGMDEEIESFAMCIRPSELVGLGDFIEQYLPHRVAMQFGFDQDIPGFVPRFNESRESAWGYYKRPIGDKILHIPPRLFESDVTSRYLAWWGTTMSAKDDKIEKDYEEDCFFLDENGFVIEDLLKFDKKTEDVDGEGFVREEKCLMSNSFEDSLPLTLENRACEDVDLVTVTESIDTSSIIVKYAEELNLCSSQVSYDAPGAELGAPGRDFEARISKLERMVAILKSENFGRNV